MELIIFKNRDCIFFLQFPIISTKVHHFRKVIWKLQTSKTVCYPDREKDSKLTSYPNYWFVPLFFFPELLLHQTALIFPLYPVTNSSSSVECWETKNVKIMSVRMSKHASIKYAIWVTIWVKHEV